MSETRPRGYGLLVATVIIMAVALSLWFVMWLLFPPRNLKLEGNLTVKGNASVHGKSTHVGGVVTQSISSLAGASGGAGGTTSSASAASAKSAKSASRASSFVAGSAAAAASALTSATNTGGGAVAFLSPVAMLSTYGNTVKSYSSASVQLEARGLYTFTAADTIVDLPSVTSGLDSSTVFDLIALAFAAVILNPHRNSCIKTFLPADIKTLECACDGACANNWIRANQCNNCYNNPPGSNDKNACIPYCVPCAGLNSRIDQPIVSFKSDCALYSAVDLGSAASQLYLELTQDTGITDFTPAVSDLMKVIGSSPAVVAIIDTLVKSVPLTVVQMALAYATNYQDLLVNHETLAGFFEIPGELGSRFYYAQTAFLQGMFTEKTFDLFNALGVAATKITALAGDIGVDATKVGLDVVLQNSSSTTMFVRVPNLAPTNTDADLGIQINDFAPATLVPVEAGKGVYMMFVGAVEALRGVWTSVDFHLTGAPPDTVAFPPDPNDAVTKNANQKFTAVTGINVAMYVATAPGDVEVSLPDSLLSTTPRRLKIWNKSSQSLNVIADVTAADTLVGSPVSVANNTVAEFVHDDSATWARIS